MKKIISTIALLVALAIAGAAQSGYDQRSTPFYSLTAATATGVGVYATLPFFGGYTLPSNFTWETIVTGAPSAVSTTLEGSIDGRSTLDGVATASSSTFTSKTIVFSAADVGKNIYIGGANTAGATLCTTISGYTNPTTVTLAAPAVVSTVGSSTFVGTFVVLDTGTNTSGEIRSVVNYPVRYIRCNLGTLTGGTAVTCAFTAKGA